MNVHGDSGPSIDAPRWCRIKSILDRLSEVKPRALGSAVDAECGDDPALRGQVLEFLAVDAASEDFIEEPLWKLLPAEARHRRLDNGSRVDCYRIERWIGQGGLGEVYCALHEANGSRVALKRAIGPKACGDLRQAFRTERRILARLHHAGIVRLLDSGADVSDLPYLVTEYVEGLAIDEHCSHRALNLRQRLQLVSEVCGVVHYAHQESVAHGDLKAANIMVTDAGRPKLLDFGTARCLDAAPAEPSETVLTLTPACASPELLDGAPASVACDVYALGILLYQLVTGRPPYDVEGLSLEGVRNRVATVSVTKPSAVMATAPTPDWPVSSRDVHSGLDSLVLKALRKKPERRYQSVADLVGALDHYLREHLSADGS